MEMMSTKTVNEYLISVGLTNEDYAKLTQQELRREIVSRLAAAFVEKYMTDIFESMDTIGMIDEIKDKTISFAEKELRKRMGEAFQPPSHYCSSCGDRL